MKLILKNRLWFIEPLAGAAVLLRRCLQGKDLKRCLMFLAG